jgi:hypothetical protein
VVAGGSGGFGVGDFIVGRVLPDGSLDPAFGGGGVIFDFGGDDRARAVAVQEDGKILAAGETDGDWAILRLRATDTNTPPVLDAIGDQTMAEADTADVGINATDAEGDSLTFTLFGEPSFATLTDHGDGTATLTLTPGFDDAGSYTGVTVTVSDSVDSDSETVTIPITDTNRARMLDAIGNSAIRTLDSATPAWLPDGKRIAFMSGRDGNAEIYVMDADGSNQTRLTLDLAGDESPAWSPGGELIAFFSYRDGFPEIYVMNADGSGVRRLTNNSVSDGSPCWSPDGEHIAFDSDRDGNWEIYVMNADGSEQVNLTQSPDEQDHFPAWGQ